MSKKEIIGHMACPVCTFQAHVKEDKNHHAYMHCTDCNAQLFTRNDYRDAKLRQRMTPVTVTVTEQKPAEPAPEPVTATPPKTAPAAPAAKPKAPPPPPPPPEAKPVKAPWFSPILGS